MSTSDVGYKFIEPIHSSPLPSEPSVSRASRGLLTLTRYTHLDLNRPGNSLDWSARLRFFCLLYDALQIYRLPSPKWIQHFGHFVAWWWTLTFLEFIFFDANKSLRGDLLWVGFTFSFRIHFQINAYTGWCCCPIWPISWHSWWEKLGYYHFIAQRFLYISPSLVKWFVKRFMSPSH